MTTKQQDKFTSRIRHKMNVLRELEQKFLETAMSPYRKEGEYDFEKHNTECPIVAGWWGDYPCDLKITKVALEDKGQYMVLYGGKYEDGSIVSDIEKVDIDDLVTGELLEVRENIKPNRKSNKL